MFEAKQPGVILTLDRALERIKQLEETLESRIRTLENIRNIQCQNGNWNFDPYMHGMANGLIMACALFRDKEPNYLVAPAKWLYEQKFDPKAKPTEAINEQSASVE